MSNRRREERDREEESPWISALKIIDVLIIRPIIMVCIFVRLLLGLSSLTFLIVAGAIYWNWHTTWSEFDPFVLANARRADNSTC